MPDLSLIEGSWIKIEDDDDDDRLLFFKFAVITQHMFHHKLCFMILHGSLFIADTLRPGSKRTRTYSRSDDKVPRSS